MSIELIIPDTVAEAIKLPSVRLREELFEELAVALYADGALSFGKARELCGMDKYDFGRLLGRRRVHRRYDDEELAEDLAYAGGKWYLAHPELGVDSASLPA